ncbi:MAG: dienelactone hydrolase family protein [Alphaproteobacteria bacterium]|nr:dienelactone hydrolase family protein [Alphaproteobacteria bacterium]
MPVKFLVDGPDGAPLTVALAHGAGEAMDGPFMTTIAEGLAAAGLRVARFEFPYMAERRKDGKLRPPDRIDVLRDSWLEAIAALGADDLVIGGKSLGGRVASLVAERAQVRGLVCLGYPFHPPGKPETLRVGHLLDMRMPALILQGTRDPFGRPSEVRNYALPPNVRIHWLGDGDHSFKPRKSSGVTEAANLARAVSAIVDFVTEL